MDERFQFFKPLNRGSPKFICTQPNRCANYDQHDSQKESRYHLSKTIILQCVNLLKYVNNTRIWNLNSLLVKT